MFSGENYCGERILGNTCTRTGTAVTHLFEAVALTIEKRSLNSEMPTHQELYTAVQLYGCFMVVVGTVSLINYDE